jgi:neutral ceramidase
MAQDTAPKTLSVGIAQADISPPVGTPSAGFAGRGPLTALHDPLYATALVLSDGKRSAALVACDLLYLNAATVNEIRSLVAQRTDIAADYVSIACTHTHYGPDTSPDRASGPDRASSHDSADPRANAYRTNLIYSLAGAIEEAASKMQPAYMGVGWGTSDIGVNRREKLPDGSVILGQNPTGPIDRAVGVLRFDTPPMSPSEPGEPIVTLINFQTHPVSQASQTSHISADYPGKACEVVESLTGAPCTFLLGASGNINASIMKPEYEPARTLGTRLGCEVVRVWETIQPKPVTGLRVQSTHVQLPRMRYGSRDNAVKLVQSLQAEIERHRSAGGSTGRLQWAQRRLDRAQSALESWTSGVPLKPVHAELQAWRIGDLALAATPGEIFTEIGLQVKGGSPFDDTFFVSCANDSIGYVPVPEAYADGGYEVTHASQVEPEAADILTAACLQLLRKLESERR